MNLSTMPYHEIKGQRVQVQLSVDSRYNRHQDYTAIITEVTPSRGPWQNARVMPVNGNAHVKAKWVKLSCLSLLQ